MKYQYFSRSEIVIVLLSNLATFSAAQTETILDVYFLGDEMTNPFMEESTAPDFYRVKCQFIHNFAGSQNNSDAQ
jgi:hypothetical protein